MATQALKHIFYHSEQIADKLHDVGTFIETKKSVNLFLYYVIFRTKHHDFNRKPSRTWMLPHKFHQKMGLWACMIPKKNLLDKHQRKYLLGPRSIFMKSHQFSCSHTCTNSQMLKNMVATDNEKQLFCDVKDDFHWLVPFIKYIPLLYAKSATHLCLCDSICVYVIM